jgi:uncharacterized protein YunC (DUF1805 family)
MSPDPITVAHEDERGRIYFADSMTYFDDRVTGRDVIMSGSYAAGPTLSWALKVGAKAGIAHAAGVGKDDAGISGLALADRFGMPAAACETMSARLADGESVHAGKIGHANETARKLGVEIGQLIAEAALKMLDGPVREPTDPGSGGVSNEILTLEETASGGIYASWGIPVLRSIKEPRPNDVFVQASHCGATLAKFVIPLKLKGVLANDAGLGKDNSGISSLGPLAEAGIAAAVVGAMSARIGDVMSTWNDGVISVVNAVAEARGVRTGMTTAEAARKML